MLLNANGYNSPSAAVCVACTAGGMNHGMLSRDTTGLWKMPKLARTDICCFPVGSQATPIRGSQLRSDGFSPVKPSTFVNNPNGGLTRLYNLCLVTLVILVGA